MSNSNGYPYGNETPLTAGINAVLDALAGGGGGGGGTTGGVKIHTATGVFKAAADGLGTTFFAPVANVSGSDDVSDGDWIIASGYTDENSAASTDVVLFATNGQAVTQADVSCFYRPVDDSHPLVTWTTGGVIEDGSITTAKLAGSAVTTQKINDSAVTADKLHAGAVSTQKLCSGAVTMAKLETTLQGQLNTTFGRIPYVVLVNGSIEYDGTYYVSGFSADDTSASGAYILAPQVVDDVGGVIHDGWVIMMLTTSVTRYGQNKWAGTSYTPLAGGGSGGGGDTFGSSAPATIDSGTGTYTVPIIDDMVAFDGVKADIAVGDYIIVSDVLDSGGTSTGDSGMILVDNIDKTGQPAVASGIKFIPLGTSA